ncbi:MAG: hypothetical protein LT070_03140 [Solirubrobacteraceae bacterium]|nr:hypothetical protein [Solirubrobacteraceae bacterium]
MTAHLPSGRYAGALAVIAWLAIALAASAALPGPSAQAAGRHVPQGFLGVNVNDGALDPGFPLERQADDMVASGVESIAAQLAWHEIQPTADGPLDWRSSDRLVRLAALRGLRLLPVVLWTPFWATRDPADPRLPPDPAAYARFMGLLANRYGTRGSFWRENPQLPRRPVRDWRIWNEPGIDQFWPRRWGMRRYVELLRAAYRSLADADRGARVVLAGLPNRSWEDLATIYRLGGGGAFDRVSLHPFTAQPRNVVRIIEHNRAVMRRHGDGRMPILLSEVAAWPPVSLPIVAGRQSHSDRRRQALRVRQTLELLVRERRRLRIDGVWWYTWFSADRSADYPFDYAGLRYERDGRILDKPALGAYRRTALRLEGCRRKGSRATRCALRAR